MPKAIKSNKKEHHGFTFTLNNWTESDKTKLKAYNSQYLIFGEEIAPTTGTPHLQGYIYFKSAKLKTTVNNYKIGHVEVAGGTAEQNKEYCTKDNKNIVEQGTMPQQGKRTDLALLCTSLRTGTSSIDDILTTNPMAIHQYGRTLKMCEDYYFRSIKRTQMTTCDWYVGPTGSGKSHKAYTENPDAYDYPYDNEWMDGYRSQEVMVINDFRGQIPYSTLLRMIDKWPFTVRVRCSQPRPFTTRHIIITSCKTPEQCYFNLSANDNIDQLLRRVKIVQFPV